MNIEAEAREIFKKIGVENDFCIQYADEDCAIFGSTNRLIWRPTGFQIDRSYCTKKFIEGFEKYFPTNY